MGFKLRSVLKAKLIAGIIATLVDSVKIPGEVLRESVDGFLDPIERWYASTNSKVDDAVYGSLSRVLRDVTNTPDDDDNS